MLIGNPGPWLTHFRDVEQRLIERLPAVWPVCTQGLPVQPMENQITRRLVYYLRRDPEARILGAIHSQLELLEEQCAGDVVPKGYIDMAIVLGEDPECYVAFECKRLNVTAKKKKSTLATPYVEEGMMRYVSAQYALNLPLGAMIGYVLDGNMVSAGKSIRRAMSVRATALFAPGKPDKIKVVGYMHRFSTLHTRPADTVPFVLRHTLLPLPVPTSNSTST